MKKPISKKEKITLESLSQQVNNHFGLINKKLIDINSKFEKTNESIEDLAAMTAKGFHEVHEKIDDVEHRVVNRLLTIENRVDSLSAHRATHDELHVIDLRVRKIEKKLASQK